MATAQAVEWIRIADEIPDESGNYLVFLKDMNAHDFELYDGIAHMDCSCVEVMHYSDEQKLFASLNNDDYIYNALLGNDIPACYAMKLTHWMPLPQFPND